MNKFRLVVLVLMLNWIGIAVAEDDSKDYFYIKPSAFTGEIFLTMSEDDKALYLLGLGDGINLAPFFKIDEEIFKKYRECFQGMTGADLANTVTNYLESHPDRKKEGIHMTAFKAYTEMCYAKDK